MYLFIKLHIIAQSGPVILGILCRTRIDPPKGVCVCVCVTVLYYCTVLYHKACESESE